MSPKKRTPRKSAKPQALVVVAHPDDEALFFGGLIMSLRQYEWTVVCVSDGNADGMGRTRHDQFRKSCRALGATAISWKFPDVFGKSFDTALLQLKLDDLPQFKTVFTHGILGEYGHAHHQDVSFAVHSALSDQSKVYSVAYNTFPELKVALSPTLFRRKQRVLWNIYASEVKRLLHFLPATSYEGFVRVSRKEVEVIYKWLRKGVPAKKADLKVYLWLYEYLKEGGGHLATRPF